MIAAAIIHNKIGYQTWSHEGGGEGGGGRNKRNQDGIHN